MEADCVAGLTADARARHHTALCAHRMQKNILAHPRSTIHEEELLTMASVQVSRLSRAVLHAEHSVLLTVHPMRMRRRARGCW